LMVFKEDCTDAALTQLDLMDCTINHCDSRSILWNLPAGTSAGRAAVGTTASVGGGGGGGGGGVGVITSNLTGHCLTAYVTLTLTLTLILGIV
jgi:hypothetical protein